MAPSTNIACLRAPCRSVDTARCGAAGRARALRLVPAIRHGERIARVVALGPPGLVTPAATSTSS
jgi:hypothetical protein